MVLSPKHSGRSADVTQVYPIVVVDDEPSLLALVCDVLEDDGLAAFPCPHGAEAYRCIREYLPQVVILDVQMPGVDGIRVFEQLRADPATAEIPVIFLTANVHILYERLPNFPAMRAIVLPKPFNVVTLLAQVRQYLQDVF
jgi:DNA-binding response OmpR family regulator